MKPIEEVNALVIDYGTFIDLAGCLAQKCANAYYYSPFEEEYRDIKTCCFGDGQKEVERIDEFMAPEFLETIDLVCFPDIGYGGLQRYLRSIGKAVWGSAGASDLELYRTRFLRTLEQIGLPVAPYKVIRGVDNLAAYLGGTVDKWVKVNRYRANMETWHHIDYAHSRAKLAELAEEFGMMPVVFVVCEPIDDATEIGYDGLSVDGRFPSRSYQGYEKKNELYLGSLLPAARLPDAVQEVNKAMAPVLAEYQYRNFWATEIRLKDGVANFIDPTARQAGQTMEHQYRSCTNLPEVIWNGANGELIDPEFSHPFAAEATIHYKGEGDGWRVLRLSEEARQNVALYHFCEYDGLYHFPPACNDEVGVVIGHGDTVAEAIEVLKENFELLEGEPVEIHLAGMADLIEEIEKAEAEGMKFGGELPEPAIAIQ